MKQGEIHMLKVDGAGKRGRPVLVVSRDELNKGYLCTIVPFNGSDFNNKRHKPFCVPFHAGDPGISKDCVAKCDDLARIPKTDLIRSSRPEGMISDAKLAEVKDAIAWCLNCQLASTASP